MATISLVSGDTAAKLQVTLVRDDTGLSFNGGGANITLKIRAKNSTSVLTTISYDSGLSNPSGGEIIFSLASFLSVAAEGFYEGEIEVFFADDTNQTVYDLVYFKVRNQF